MKLKMKNIKFLFHFFQEMKDIFRNFFCYFSVEFLQNVRKQFFMKTILDENIFEKKLSMKRTKKYFVNQ